MDSAHRLPEDRILVAGSASRSVAADRAVWRLVVVERGDVAADAFARCSERLELLTEGLRAAFGDGADVHTGSLSVEPQYDHGGRPLAAVEVTGQVTVEVALADIGRAAGEAMASGADHLRGPVLTVSEHEAIQEELLRDAVAAARRKAEQLALATGRTLGRVVSVAEDDRDGGIPVAIRASSYEDGPNLAPAARTIAATVHVVFALDG